MADPVMGNLPLRRVLECVTRDFQTRPQIVKAYSMKYPMEAWIRFSNKLRRSIFKEEKEEEIDGILFDLVLGGYIRLPEGVKNERYARGATYCLTDFGGKVLGSVKKKHP